MIVKSLLVVISLFGEKWLGATNMLMYLIRSVKGLYFTRVYIYIFWTTFYFTHYMDKYMSTKSKKTFLSCFFFWLNFLICQWACCVCVCVCFDGLGCLLLRDVFEVIGTRPCEDKLHIYHHNSLAALIFIQFILCKFLQNNSDWKTCSRVYRHWKQKEKVKLRNVWFTEGETQIIPM